MTRWKAASIHLGISAAVIGTVVTLIYFLWFPHGLFRVSGMDQMLVTMLGVDIAVGPLLTLLVYKTGKRTLKLDLTVVTLLQAAFLGYALHTAWVTRPVFLVWAIDGMKLVTANEIEPRNLAQGTSPEMRSLPSFGPRLVGTVAPRGIKQREAYFKSLILSQNPIERLPRYYLPYAASTKSILRVAKRLDVATVGERLPEDLVRSIAATGRKRDDLRYVTVESSRDAAILLVDARNAAPLTTAAFTDITKARPSASQ